MKNVRFCYFRGLGISMRRRLQWLWLAKRESLSSHFESAEISLHVKDHKQDIFSSGYIFSAFFLAYCSRTRTIINMSITSMIYRILLVITLVTMETSADVQFSWRYKQISGSLPSFWPKIEVLSRIFTVPNKSYYLSLPSTAHYNAILLTVSLICRRPHQQSCPTNFVLTTKGSKSIRQQLSNRIHRCKSGLKRL